MSLSNSLQTPSTMESSQKCLNATKRCKVCQKKKLLSEFGKARSNKDGHHGTCKKCDIKRSSGAADIRPCDGCDYEQRCADLKQTCVVFRHWVETGVSVDRAKIPDQAL